MDINQLAGKPVKLNLKTGIIKLGWFQKSVINPLTDNLAPFLTLEKKRKLQKRFKFNSETQVAIPAEVAAEYIETINVDSIESYELIETTIKSIRLNTESGKIISKIGIKVAMEFTDWPGHIKVNYMLPDNEKEFKLGTLEVKDGAISLPVTLAFVSYAKEDQQEVTIITNKLNDKGVVTWFDDSDLLPGDDWQLKIERAIKDADYFLLFLSSRTIERVGFKNRELHLALYQQSLQPAGRIYIIPILIDDCIPPDDLNRLNWLRTTSENWFEKLLKAIAPKHQWGQ